MESDKVYTVVEVPFVEDTNVLHNCDQFSDDYKQLIIPDIEKSFNKLNLCPVVLSYLTLTSPSSSSLP